MTTAAKPVRTRTPLTLSARQAGLTLALLLLLIGTCEGTRLYRPGTRAGGTAHADEEPILIDKSFMSNSWWETEGGCLEQGEGCTMSVGGGSQQCCSGLCSCLTDGGGCVCADADTYRETPVDGGA